MAIHSSILAWKLPWTEEPGGPQSMGYRVSQNWEHLHVERVWCRNISKEMHFENLFEFYKQITVLKERMLNSILLWVDNVAVFFVLWDRYCCAAHHICTYPSSLFLLFSLYFYWAKKINPSYPQGPFHICLCDAAELNQVIYFDGLINGIYIYMCHFFFVINLRAIAV